jgi:hypothetical protein
VYKDGKTAFENWKNRKFKGQYREFGEGVLYLRPNSKGKDKFDNRWETGVWLGIADRTGETIIGTKDGVIKARDTRSIDEKEAWDPGRFNDIRGTPWEPILGQGSAELRSKIVIPINRTAPGQLVEGEEKDLIVRRMRISRETIRKLGFTIGCLGCRAVNRGQSAVNHNEECRKRVEGIIRESGNQTIIRADERIKERNEDRENKRRRVATDNEDNASRGGVVEQQQRQDQQEQQQQQQDQQRQEVPMEEEEVSIGSISIQSQVVDMSNWDFGKASTMQESMETIRKRKARAIVLSTVMNASEFEGRCKTEDPYKLIRQSINRTIKMVKCAKEQDKRGLYFVLEAIEGDDNEINQVVGNLINQKGIMVSD